MLQTNSGRIILLATLGICTAGLALAGGDGADRAFIRNAQDADIEWGPCPGFMPESCRLAVVQGDPAKPNADVFFKLPGNTSVPSHWHHSAERMVLVSGEMQVTYDGQDPVVLQTGTYAYGPPELPHTATCQSSEDCVLVIAFEKPVDAIPTEAE